MQKHEAKRIRILSALPILGHPRDSKRVSMLLESGFDVSVAAFQRDYHKGRMPDCETKVLAVIKHGHYFQRILIILKSLFSMRGMIKETNLVYASGLDMAFMSILAGVGLKRPVIIEIGDVREIQVSYGLKGRLARMVDRFVMNRCSLLVATAPDFVSEYYRKWLKVETQALVIENKLESHRMRELLVAPVEAGLFVRRPLRIGYFGLLRCEWSWSVLVALAEARSDIEIVVAGHILAPENMLDDISKHKNITYVGEYKSPQGLPELYNAVDMIWACYPPIKDDDWNLKWARPNRFYEACFFKRPLISRLGSNDSKSVDKYKIGLILDAVEPSEVVASFSAISAEDVFLWHENMVQLNSDEYFYAGEQEHLKRSIHLLTKNLD
jgi:succinoglycan biosynthesis protein ExoL